MITFITFGPLCWELWLPFFCSLGHFVVRHYLFKKRVMWHYLKFDIKGPCLHFREEFSYCSLKTQGRNWMGLFQKWYHVSNLCQFFNCFRIESHVHFKQPSLAFFLLWKSFGRVDQEYLSVTIDIRFIWYHELTLDYLVTWEQVSFSKLY